MGYFDRGVFTFLNELKSHNDRAWFTANKERYERDVKEPLLDFIADAGPALARISRNLVADPKPVGGSLFRIYRDVRFSKDKSPYKTHAAARFPLGGTNVHGPGLYLHLEPGGCFVGGGMWMPHGPELLKIRHRIAEKPAAWERARGRLDDGYESLKRPPRGFDPDHPMIEDLKRRSFTASSRLTQKQVLADNFMLTFTARCTEISPLLRFLADAVGVAW